MEKVQELCKTAETGSVLVFRGFPAVCAREILSQPESICAPEEIFTKEGWLDAEKAAASGEKFAADLIGKTGTVMMIYEQLLAITPKRMPEGRQVRIIDNDLFPNQKPCLLSPERAASFAAGLQKGVPNEEDEVLFTFYGDIQEVQKGCWMVSLRNCHTDAGYPIEGFYQQEGWEPQPQDSSAPEIETAGSAFLAHCLAVQEGRVSGEGNYRLDTPEDLHRPELRAFFRMLTEEGTVH